MHFSQYVRAKREKKEPRPVRRGRPPQWLGELVSGGRKKKKTSILGKGENQVWSADAEEGVPCKLWFGQTWEKGPWLCPNEGQRRGKEV